MRSLHWSVHPNGRLEVDAHGLDAVELRGVEDGAVIAGGDDGRQQSPPSERRSDLHCAKSSGQARCGSATSQQMMLPLG